MDDRALLRYSRHILLDELGVEAQDKLLASHALIVGAGGLGCPAALYLAASGIGRITLADGDRVDLTNLQRQILYREPMVGAPKARSARAALLAANPDIEIIALGERLEGQPLDTQVAGADVVLDCSDNFATRHAINRACVRHAKPLVSGAAIRFDGQLAAFDLRHGTAPCYACLFPERGETEQLPCSVMGVFSPLTGTIGTLQAAEAIKLLTGVGESLNGRLQMFDALHAEWRTVRIRKDPGCEVCGEKS